MRFKAFLILVATSTVLPLAVHAEEQPISAGASPVETGSVENAVNAAHPDAPIGQAARDLFGPSPEDHLLPEAASASAAEPPKPSPEDEDRAALRAFYEARKDAPLWVTSGGYTDRAKATISELRRAADWALAAKDYEVPVLDGASLAHDALAKAESELSLAVLHYARDARGGRIPEPNKQLSSYLDRRPQLRDRKTLLEDIANRDDPGALLRDLQPKHAQFEALRQAWLEAERAKAAKAVKLLAGDDLKEGDTHADVAVLRKRLAVAAEAGSDETRFDERLSQVLKGFQTLKGLTPADGVLTSETRAKLNQPIKGERAQLAANLQQWRWMPESLGDMYVWVNVPEYTIRIVKNGEVVFTERITAGLVNKQTPIFSDQMERVTFKSRWRVPDSIKVREIWPSLLRGGGMMRQHRLEMRRAGTDELVDWRKIDWSKVNMTDYVVWQPPGPWNQLGVVKFSFPSKHYVFMHDTPDKYMFNWSRRANSHGCMRIRNPLNMATVVLGTDQGWDRAKIDDLVKSGPDHNIIELGQKIPVHITYFTARVEDGGKIASFGDIYGHERRVKQALAGEWQKIAVGPDHLAPVDQTAIPRVAGAKARPAKKGDDSVQSLVNAVLGGL